MYWKPVLSSKTSTPVKKKVAPKNSNKLNIINLNLQLVVNKVSVFHSMIEIEKSDVATGTESCLSLDVTNGELFWVFGSSRSGVTRPHSSANSVNET